VIKDGSDIQSTVLLIPLCHFQRRTKNEDEAEIPPLAPYSRLGRDDSEVKDGFDIQSTVLLTPLCHFERRTKYEDEAKQSLEYLELYFIDVFLT